jgi:hypothetical protein
MKKRLTLSWKNLTSGLLAALVGGFVLGIGGRIAMVLIALSHGTPERPSLEGSIEVVITGLLIGVPAGLLFLGLRKHLPIPGLWKGAAWGMGVFAVLAIITPPAAESAIKGIGSHIIPITIVLFGLLFSAYGIVVEAVMQKCESGKNADN